MSKKLIIEEFSPARIALAREVKNHPPLLQLLATYEADDWGGAIGEIAAYCGIVMEGNYMPSELEILYEKLFWELKSAGTITVQQIIH